MEQNFPDLRAMAKSVAMSLDAVEVIRQPLYDYVVYPTAGVLFQQFFINPQGAGLSASQGFAGNGKALSDTNMQIGGQLASPQAFFCDGIEVDVQPGSVATANTFTPTITSAIVAANAAVNQAGAHDVNAVYTTGALTFNIGGKAYYTEGPLYQFPPRYSLTLDVGLASNSATAVEVLKEKLNVDGETMKLDPGVGIGTSMNFNVAINWPALVPTPSGFNARLGVVLSGWLFRAVQ